MNPLTEIKQLVDRLNRGIVYLERAYKVEDIERGLRLFHEVSVELAEKVVVFERLHGKIDWWLLCGSDQLKMEV